jgi:hypothetical protein
MKNKYENTKPIRGRSTDERPWGERRRDAELIVQTTRVLDGAVVYGARLHGTNVLEVDAKGTLTFRCDGWVTPTTTDYLHRVLRELGIGGACRRFNKVWVNLNPYQANAPKWAYIPRSGTIDVPHNPDTDTYVLPLQSVVKRTTDTIKMKELRAKIKGFQTYYRSLLKLSEGVVTAQFKADNMVLSEGRNHWERYQEVDFKIEQHPEPRPVRSSVYFRLRSLTSDAKDTLFAALTEGKEENYAPLLTWFANCADSVGEGYTEPVTFKNGVQGQSVTIPVNVDQIDRMVTNIIKDIGNAYVYTHVLVTEPIKDDSDKA